MLRSFFARITQPESAPPWKSYPAIQTLVTAYMMMLIGTAITLILFGVVPFAKLLSWVIGAILTLIFVWFTRRKPEDRAALRLGTVTNTSLLLTTFFCFGVALTVDVLRRYQAVPELAFFGGTAAEWILAVLFMVILQPIAEEIVFRGILYPALRVTFGVWTGVVACTLGYALFHFITYSYGQVDANTLWVTLALPYIESLVLTLIRAYTGSTRAAIFAHMAFGVFAVVKLFSLGSGQG